MITGQQWSPEQISKRMELKHGGPVVSYSTIYRVIRTGYMKPNGRKKKEKKHGHFFIERYLPRKGWRGKKKKVRQKAYVHCGIDERPTSTENQSQFGYFEGDLVYSSYYKLYMITLVGRRSWFFIAEIHKTKKPAEVAQTMASMLEVLPDRLVRSIILDRRKEFANQADITAKILKCSVLFCASCLPLGKRNQ